MTTPSWASLLTSVRYKVTETFKQAGKEKDKFKKNLGGLGGVIRQAFSYFLGGSIFVAVMRVVHGFQELLKVGEEYAQAIYP